jgi:hypothetical protein
MGPVLVAAERMRQACGAKPQQHHPKAEHTVRASPPISGTGVCGSEGGVAENEICNLVSPTRPGASAASEVVAIVIVVPMFAWKGTVSRVQPESANGDRLRRNSSPPDSKACTACEDLRCSSHSDGSLSPASTQMRSSRERRPLCWSSEATFWRRAIDSRQARSPQ